MEHSETLHTVNVIYYMFLKFTFNSYEPEKFSKHTRTFIIFKQHKMRLASINPARICQHLSVHRTQTYVHNDHGLCDSASPVLTATGFVNEKWQFSTPYRIDTPQLIAKKVVTVEYVGNPYSCAKFGAHIRMRRASGRMGEIQPNFHLFIYAPFWELTYRSATIDMGRKLVAPPSFWGGELGPHLTQSHLG